jgi:hypothetical protein
MKVKGRINNISLDLKGNALITLEVYEKHTLLREYEPLKDEEILDIEIKKHRKKRSLNANSYLWVLINEMGNALRSSKEEVYLLMLKRYGQSELVSILSSIEVSGYFKYYEVAGTTLLNGKEFTHYRIYKGSSEFDTREMALLIDGVVSECKELGISTLTPSELDALKNSWNASNSKQ